MAKNETKNYFSPEIIVVKFKVENGFDVSGFTEREEETGRYDLVGDPEDESTQRESWGTFN